MARQRQGNLLVEQAQQVLLLARQGVARGEILLLMLQRQLLGKLIGVELSGMRAITSSSRASRL